MTRWLILLTLTITVVAGFVAVNSLAASVQPSAELAVTLQLVTTANDSTDVTITEVTHADDNRLFVAEQGGLIHVVENGTLLPTPFLDLTGEVQLRRPNGTCGECGLLGLVFHPDYAINGYFYVNYSELVTNDTIVERFQVSSTDPNVATKTGRQVVIKIEQDFANHNGGSIHFGADDMLYIGMGDGGSGGDPNDRAQDGNSLLGKMLRLNVTGVTTYTIPADNPFLADVDVRDEIWALGLRNPWRFRFDDVTGDMWIGDVGQSGREEINHQPAGVGGQNYGWDCREGSINYGNSADSCATTPLNTLTSPVFEYNYYGTGGTIQGCSVTGGTVYRGNHYPEFQGHYFFADYCEGDIWTLSGDPANLTFNTTTAAVPSNPTTFGTNAIGELFVGYNNGQVYQITNGTPLAVSLSNAQIVEILPILLIASTLLGLLSWRLLKKA